MYCERGGRVPRLSANFRWCRTEILASTPIETRDLFFCFQNWKCDLKFGSCMQK